MPLKKLQKWLLVDSKRVLSSKWLSVEQRTYKLPNGKIVDDYYHVDRPDYVLVVATDKNNRLLLERQYRRGVDDFVYELPAGWIKEGETPIQTAKRELKEETGAIGTGDRVVEIFPQPGFSSMKAFVCFLTVDGQTDRQPGEDEFIAVEWMQRETVNQMIRTGQLKDMGSLAALNLTDDKSQNNK
jgi:ADP-ribose pyrophosphatase